MRGVTFPIISLFVFALCLAPAIHAQSATQQVIYSFCQVSNCPDGSTPSDGMALLADGTFVVAASAGEYNGAIVQLTPTDLADVYSGAAITDFCGGASACSSGGNPVGVPVQGLDGAVYYVNTFGGFFSSTGETGSGTIGKLVLGGAGSTVLYTFCALSNCDDGAQPGTGLIQGTDGNFYGTTAYGGTTNNGTVFRMSPSGNITTLHSFCMATNCTDGATPDSALLQGADGNFYGTTTFGGSGTQGPGGGDGSGTIYQITPAGDYVVIHSFCTGGTGCPDGQYPEGNLVQVENGNIYGVTSGGGNSFNAGIVYYIDTSGSFNAYEDFGCVLAGTPCITGFFPNGGLIQGSDGNLYGTVTSTNTKASRDPYGAIFKLPLNGTAATNVAAFCTSGSPCTNGENPGGDLILGSDGNLYGVIDNGGASGYGVAYFITSSSWLQPPVQLSFSATSIAANSPVTLSWSVPYAYSKTAQLCGAFIQNSAQGAGTWTGQQTGTYSNHAYSGSSVITPTAEGTYTYALTCGGKESGFATLTVTAPVKISSATALSASPNPAIVGQTVTLKATVTGSGKTPTGSVSFTFNGSSQGSVTLNSSGVATASVSTSGLAPGKYSASADYAGDSAYNSSLSPTVTVTVSKANSASSLSVSPAAPSIGQSATLKATVTGSSGTPSGSVTFSADGVTLGSASLNGSGVASFSASTNGIPPGTYPVTAAYSGNSSYNSSVSSTINVKLSKAATDTSLTVSPASVTPPANVTLSATVSRTASSTTGTPTGSITFAVGTDVLAIVGLDGKGVASLTAPSKGYPAGSYPITATYSGDSADSSSSSSSVTITVK
jgi:uncharacterized repeat protein (TIGR03803 family)